MKRPHSRPQHAQRHLFDFNRNHIETWPWTRHRNPLHELTTLKSTKAGIVIPTASEPIHNGNKHMWVRSTLVNAQCVDLHLWRPCHLLQQLAQRYVEHAQVPWRCAMLAFNSKETVSTTPKPAVSGLAKRLLGQREPTRALAKSQHWLDNCVEPGATVQAFKRSVADTSHAVWHPVPASSQ